jgi:hypothetical protein
MPDYTEKAERLNAFVLAYGDTTYSVNAIKTALLEAYEDGLTTAATPVAPPVLPAVPEAPVVSPDVILDSEVTQ